MTIHNTNLTKIGAIALAVAVVSGAYAIRSRAINAQDAPNPTPAAATGANATDAPNPPAPVPSPALGDAPQAPNGTDIDAALRAALSGASNVPGALPGVLPANPPRPASQAYAPDFNADQGELDELRAKIRTLQAQLNKTPTTLDEQLEQRKVVDELAATQAKIRELEANAGQFAAYRRYRDMQAGSPFSSDADPNRRQAILDESGLNSNSIADRIGGGSALTFGEAQMLRDQKEALTAQYRQYQQTLRALQPGDAGLAENLKKEQDTVLAQIKEINLRLVGAPTSPEGAANPLNLANPTNPGLGAPNAGLGAAGVSAYGMTLDVAAKMQKVEEAARLLREAGLTQLAGWEANEVPKLSEPNYVETPLTMSATTNSAADYNPFLQPAKQDLQAINDSIAGLKSQIETLAESLANVEVQLKLLSRQAVAAPAPGDAPATPNAVPADPTSESSDASDATNDASALPEEFPELNELPSASQPSLID